MAIKRIFWYLVGLFLCAFGVVISIKSNLGVTPISTMPYTLSLILNEDLGIVTALFQTTLVIIQFILLRSRFKLKFLLQIPAGFMFGYFTDVAVFILSPIAPPTDIFVRIIFMIVSLFVSALGLFIFLKQDVISLAGEGTIQAIAIILDKKFSTIKVLFDSTMVILSFLLSLFILNDAFISVNIGTIVSAIFIGIIIGWIEMIYIKVTGNDPNLKNE